jgi:ElaB/YqjD/DUF883 family membrane-anchored ribosome-binding protein
MKDNGGRRPEQILTDIHRTRDELEKTLTAIEHRLTPGQLVDQGIDYLRQSGANEFVQNLGGAAKQNPLPVALVGIGLAWLMALGRQPAQSYGSPASGARLQEGMSSARDKASGAMQSASETLWSTKERISGTVSSMRERASDVTGTARQQWERARDGLDHLVHEQPLALGAIGLAIGAILGAAAPRTREEERLMGEASRRLNEKARQMGSQQLEKAEQTVKQVAETVGQGSQRGTESQPGQPEGNVPSPQVEPSVRVQPPDKGSW